MNRLLTIIVLLSLLESCGFIHKTFDRKKENYRENSKASTDSVGKKTADSSVGKFVDSTKLKKTEEKKTEGVVIEFSDSSDHNKVEITTDSSGKQVIKAEGKIKSVKTSKRQEKKQVDSSHLQKKDTAAKHTSEQGSVKRSEDKKQSGSTNVVQKKKTAIQIPWYAYLIGIVLFIMTLLILWKRYKYQIIAWIIRLKNPGTNVYYDPKIKGYQIINKKKSNTS